MCMRNGDFGVNAFINRTGPESAIGNYAGIDMKTTSLNVRMAVIGLIILGLAGCSSGTESPTTQAISGAIDSSDFTTTDANPVSETSTPTASDTDTSLTEVDPADTEQVVIAAQREAITFGTVRTVEVEGVVFTSLPEAEVDTSVASVELGRLLFWDPILSGDMDTACATCHLPEFGYTDGRARSIGTTGQGTGPNRVPGEIGLVPRNAQTVLNTVWNGINEIGVFNKDTAPMFWDNRTQSLANQAIEPLHSREEMRGNNFTEAEIDLEIASRLSNIAEYRVLFEQAYGDSAINVETVGQALADFQSTLIANNSPFDRWMRGDANAMSDAQLNGMRLFADTGCAECHSGPMFSDYETHVLGVREANGLAEADNGNGNFAFRTPSLRQLEFTAPYFHGGQDNDLDDVIDFYDNPNNSENPNVANNQLDPDFRALPNINNNRSNAIEAFLGALNDGNFDQSRPNNVPSGLPVGGAL